MINQLIVIIICELVNKTWRLLINIMTLQYIIIYRGPDRWPLTDDPVSDEIIKVSGSWVPGLLAAVHFHRFSWFSRNVAIEELCLDSNSSHSVGYLWSDKASLTCFVSKPAPPSFLSLQWDKDLGARSWPLGAASLVVGCHRWQVSAAGHL